MIGVPVEAYTALWIEIRPWQASVVGLRSRLIQPCGLKYRQHKCFTCIDRSRLIQPCGLKLAYSRIRSLAAESRLIQPCGLKYSFDNCFFPIYSRGLYSLVD